MNKEQQVTSFIEYLRKAGLANLPINHPVFDVYRGNEVDITMSSKTNKKLDITMKPKNGQKLSVGDLVSHVTVPTLGYGLVVAESDKHPNYWIVKWCDPRFCDVGELGIQAMYLAKVN